MTEREVKNENPFKDHILEKLFGKKNFDSKSDGIFANGFENQNSILPPNSHQKLKTDFNKTNSSTGIEILKNHTVPEYLNDNGEIDELMKIPEKNKRNFKSMTIDRMGKMLKFKSPMSNQCKSESKNNEQNENETTIFYPNKLSSKEKTNSLGRVFKIIDKDINPRRIFGSSLSSSKLSKSTKKTKFTNDEKKSKQDDSIRRAFSKIISQLKGRSKSEKTPAEPNIRIPNEDEVKSKDSQPTASRTALATRIISSLSSSPSRLSAIKKSTPLTHDPTSSTSGIP
ncbi:uncharacterized protein LOC127289189 [Leptopilina boulardi]|uniref:uncharacterized protein LOC127289189 n=1 Tax=Leptopilina boulardi TaxID=63433 RepID=UPI0021F62830|nr:uncharacterized protein LOC127289189 [Leptopilina boulardi]